MKISNMGQHGVIPFASAIRKQQLRNSQRLGRPGGAQRRRWRKSLAAALRPSLRAIVIPHMVLAIVTKGAGSSKEPRRSVLADRLLGR